MLQRNIPTNSVPLMSSIATTRIKQSAILSTPSKSSGSDCVLKLGCDVVAFAVRACDGHGVSNETGLREEGCDGAWCVSGVKRKGLRGLARWGFTYLEPVLGKTAALMDPKRAVAARIMVENCILEIFTSCGRIKEGACIVKDSAGLRTVY